MAEGDIQVIQQGPNCFIGKVTHKTNRNPDSLRNFLTGLSLTIDSYEFNSSAFTVFLPTDVSERNQVIEKIKSFI